MVGKLLEKKGGIQQLLNIASIIATAHIIGDRLHD